MRHLTVLLGLLLTVSPALAGKREVLPGPIPAVVEKVIDGDTLLVRAHIWVGQDVSVLVRIDGVDTPELSGRCEIERDKARDARGFVIRKVGGRAVLLTDVRRGKYAGRVIAKVALPGGSGDLGALLLKTGHGKPYEKRRYSKWCCKGSACAADKGDAAQPARFSKLRDFFKLGR